MLSDYFKRCPTLSYPPTLSTLTFSEFFFFSFTPTHVCWDSSTETHQSNTCWFVEAICCDSLCVYSSGSEVPLSREEEVDLTLLKNDGGVESALLYAKAWSKYIKDLLSWMEKRLAMGETVRQKTLLLSLLNNCMFEIHNLKSDYQHQICYL